MSGPIIIKLTRAQIKQLAPIYARVSSEARKGKPPVALAQVGLNAPDELRVGFLSHEWAERVQSILHEYADILRRRESVPDSPAEPMK